MTRWKKAPKLVWNTVKRGFHWKWVSKPPPLFIPTKTQHEKHLVKLVQDWVLKGVIYPVQNQPCFLSRIFTVPKKDHSLRLIIDLSLLNQYVRSPPFTLDNHLKVSRIMITPVWMASLDIKEAYTHIPMRKNLHRYLAFSLQNQLYFFKALPFGLSPAPFIFTQVLNWPLQILRQEGIQLVAYLDDIIIWNRHCHILLTRINRVLEVLQYMGFNINYKKSALTPTQVIDWLGISWMGKTGQWSVIKSMQQKITMESKSLLQAERVTRRQWESFLGTLNFACQIHSHLRPLFQPLSRTSCIASAENRDLKVILPNFLKIHLHKWCQENIWIEVPFFHSPFPRHCLWTDASKIGWGALLD